MIEDAQKLFEHIGVNIDPSVKLGSLTVGKQQMVEIAKAVSHESRILVLDEPTAALTEAEVEELFAIMNDLRSRGIGMIYISHRMNEITRISDRVTVMRDGTYVGTVNTADTTSKSDEIVKMMVGRVILGDHKQQSTCPPDAETVLEVRGLCSGRAVRDVSFTLRRGEILGFAGLMGAGRTETARAIYGADPIDSGEIYIRGQKVTLGTPQKAVKAGICYLSEDRKRYGLMLDKSVAENTALASLDSFISGGFIRDGKIVQAAEEYNAKLRTKTPSMQQKAAQPLGRKPAEGRYRPLAAARLGYLYIRRAYERNRYRSKERDIYPYRTACGGRKGDNRHILGACRDTARV